MYDSITIFFLFFFLLYPNPNKYYLKYKLIFFNSHIRFLTLVGIIYIVLYTFKLLDIYLKWSKTHILYLIPRNNKK